MVLKPRLRGYASTSAPAKRVGWDTVNHLIQQKPAYAKLPDRSVLSVAGPGVGQFLDGLISGKMPEDSARAHFYSVFLNAKGRILYDVFLHSNAAAESEPGYLIEYDARPSEAPPLLQMLKRHLLRSKIKVRDLSENYDVWTMWSPHLTNPGENLWEYHPTGVIEPAFALDNTHRWGTQPMPFVDSRAVGMGTRALVPKSSPNTLVLADDVAEVTAEDYRLHRYLNGVPEGVDDLPPMHAFPINSSLDIMGALNFRKGCHLGQEHLSRARYVNSLRRRLFPVIIHREGESVDDAWKTAKPTFAPNTEISTRRLISGEDQPVSRVKSSLVSSVRGVGLAMLRTEDVEGWDDSHCVFEFEHPDVSGEEAVKWTVTPSRPSWWPNPRQVS